MSIALDKAEVIALVLECCFFGIFTPFFVVTLWVLFNKSSTGHTSRPLVIIVCFMYILAVAHLSIDVYRAVKAFVDYADIPHGSIVFYAKLNAPTEIAKTALYALQMILADGFFVWRCYIVWNKRWYIIVLPVMMVLGTTTAAVVVCWEFSRTKPGNVVFESLLSPWISFAWSMSLATTLTCTGLIAFRIWRSQRLLRETRLHSTLLPVMVMIIESGALYAAALISIIAAYAAGSNSQYIIVDFLTSLIGIVFTLIIIRVALGISSNGSSAVRSQVARSVPDFASATRHRNTSSIISMKPMSFLASVEMENGTAD